MGDSVPVNKTYAPLRGRLFVEDLIKLYRRRGLMLLYEGTPFSGEFMIVSYNPSMDDRLRKALIDIKEVTNE